MWADNVDSAPGSVSQVAPPRHELTSFAKRRGVSVILVGHVTKDGQIAGPRVVEHMVDTVLYFEGERWGTSSESCARSKTVLARRMKSACSKMTGQGLAEVTNPLPCSCPNAAPPRRVGCFRRY